MKSKNLLPKVIALDFDGVIVESCHIKRDAMNELFAPYRYSHPEILEYFESFPNLSRHEKFEHILTHFLPNEDKMARKKEWADTYSKATRNAVINCPFVEGAFEFLETFAKSSILYLASATPSDELTIIMRERKLDCFFKRIYGAPLNKAKVLEEIVATERISKTEILFVGDSVTDQQAADLAGIPFVGREADFQFPDKINCKNLFELRNLITQGAWQ